MLAFALVGVQACTSQPDAEPVTAVVDSPTAPAGTRTPSPRVIGKCCPEADSAIYAIMARYESTPEAERPPELAIQGYRMSSGMTESERLIVRDSAAWTALWPRIVGSHRPMSRVPAVDFANEMLIVVSMGTRNSGGYTIHIDSVTAVGDSLQVAVRERSPGPRCGTTAALTAPVALARVERSDLPVGFSTRATVHDCP